MTTTGDLIALHSTDGQQLLEETKLKTNGSCQETLHAIFAKQTTNFTCGMASCAMVLCAHALSNRTAVDKTKLPYSESNMFDFPQTLTVTNLEKMREEGGLTLDQLGDLFVSHGCKVKLRHASDSSAEEFRFDAIAALSQTDSTSGVVINYKQDVLGQGVPYGHISPLAAYHASSDRLLILDTWPETEECWAKVDDLFVSMNTVDSVCGKTRGYIIVTF